MQNSSELLKKGVDYFNTAFYFEAHEAFEEIWMDVRGPDRIFYQGLVQLATGFYHLDNKNKNGAFRQLSKSVSKLKQFKPDYLGIELDELLKQVLIVINKIENSPGVEFPLLNFENDIPLLFLESIK